MINDYLVKTVMFGMAEGDQARVKPARCSDNIADCYSNTSLETVHLVTARHWRNSLALGRIVRTPLNS